MTGFKTVESATSCNLCGGREAVVAGTRGRFGVPLRNLLCLRCTLVWVDPRSTQEELSAWYRDGYHSAYAGVGLLGPGGKVIAAGTPEHERMGRQALSDRVDAILKWTDLGALGRRARVLEVGCRDGRLLEQLRDRAGSDVFGLEPSFAESDAAIARGIPCTCDTLEGFAPTQPFDAILLFHVLEHLRDPSSAIRKLRSMLAPGGALIVEVPNLYRPYGSLEDNFFQDAHLYTFSPRTLAWMMSRAGLAPQLSAKQVLFAVARPADSVEPDFAAGEGAEWVLRHLAAYRRWHRVTTMLAAGGYDDRTEAACHALDRGAGGDNYKRHAFLRVGCAAIACGRHEAARRWLERCVELGDRDPDVASMLDKLRHLRGVEAPTASP